MIKWVHTPLVAILLVGGCTVGPTYAPLQSELPSSYPPSPSIDTSSQSLTTWWTQFHDPLLDRLVARGLADNLDIQTAGTRVKEARIQEAIERGAGAPQVSASAQASYTKLSANSLGSALSGLLGGGSSGSSSGIGLPGSDFPTYQMGFDASWELDLFGGQRRANEAVAAKTESAIWSSRDAQVTLTAEIANTYLQYRLIQQRLSVVDQSIETDNDLLDIANVRISNGLTNTLDQQKQVSEQAQLKATRADLQAQAETHLHMLAYLLGPLSDSLIEEVRASSGPSPVIATVPAGLPSDLLSRRPDIRAADRQWAAATADIGVAKADLYPKLSLTGALQLVSQDLSTLLDSDSVQSNAGAKLSLPLLNGGARRGTVSLREAQAEEAGLTYRQKVFGAFRDVRDGLSRLDADRDKLDQLRVAEAAARESTDTLSTRYHAGLISLPEVLQAQKTWLNAQDATAQAEAAAAQDMVSLYKALGGGWDATTTNTIEGPVRGKAN